MEIHRIVLRKSVGALSAGTDVTDLTFDELEALGIDDSNTTVLRSRTDLVPARNRWKRREVKRRTYETLQKLREGEPQVSS